MSPIGPMSPIRPIHGAGSLSGLPSRIKTASLMTIPRSQARNFPSRDHAKRKIRSEVKLVNWRAWPHGDISQRAAFRRPAENTKIRLLHPFDEDRLASLKWNQRGLVPAVFPVLAKTGDPFSIGGNGWADGKSGTQLSRLPAVDRNFPERRPVAAIRRVDDPASVRRETGKIIELPMRQTFQSPAVNLHTPDISAPGAIRVEDDVAAVRRDSGQDVVLRVSRQLSLLFAVGGRDPDVDVAAGL